MRRKGRLPELLCPAGSFECLIAAVKGGADALYIGGQAFGARAYAKNFDKEELSLAVRYCHAHGVKIYVTVNTLVYDREMAELSDYAAYLYEIGVDAVISADIGAIKEIRRRVPKMPIHASTQMTVHNTLGADAAYSIGCERVVLARELSLENIRNVTEKSRPEIEIFLHGALCVSVSGQCLMSSLVGGRSGNRGECAQPCRLPYGKGYPLSLRDLSLASHITELIDSGVSSLKIEGRMKSPAYVYTVTSIYRKLLDEGRNANKSEYLALETAFSRGGFTDGYFVSKTDKGMCGVRSEEDKEKSQKIGEFSFSPEKVKACASVRIKRGEPVSLTLTTPYKTVSVSGEVPSDAINAPLTRESVSERISKMGNTYLSLAAEYVDMDIDEGLNLSPASLNALRRNAAMLIEVGEREKITAEPYVYERESAKTKKPFRTSLFFSAEEYRKTSDKINPYFDIVFLPLFDIKETDSGVGAYLPPVIFDSELPSVEAKLSEVAANGVKYALIGNIGQIELVKRYGIVPVGDFRLNITNRLTRSEYERLGVENPILSPELTLPMARDVFGGVITLGRIPLMLTERCFIKDNFGCDRCSRTSLFDRLGSSFPMIREYPHRNIILNSQITYMGDKKSELISSGINHEHFIFSTERSEEILSLINSYNEGKSLSCPVRRVGRREEKKKEEKAKMNKYANKMHKK